MLPSLGAILLGVSCLLASANSAVICSSAFGRQTLQWEGTDPCATLTELVALCDAVAGDQAVPVAPFVCAGVQNNILVRPPSPRPPV